MTKWTEELLESEGFTQIATGRYIKEFDVPNDPPSWITFYFNDGILSGVASDGGDGGTFAANVSPERYRRILDALELADD